MIVFVAFDWREPFFAQPGIDRESGVCGVVDATAKADSAVASRSDGPAGPAPTMTANHSVTPITADAQAAVASISAGPAIGLVVREIDGDAGHGDGTRVGERAASPVASRRSKLAGASAAGPTSTSYAAGAAVPAHATGSRQPQATISAGAAVCLIGAERASRGSSSDDFGAG